jgi:glycosyltransferase involved in cell wall biosynthesis
MQILWLSHVIPYPPKAGLLLRAYYLLKSVAERNAVDLVAFVQRPLLETYYPNIEEGIVDCRKMLERICRSVTFLPITSMERPFGKHRTALAGLLQKDCYTVRWLASKRADDVLSQLSTSNRYDLAHFDTISLARYRRLFPGVPATLGYHNIESHMFLRRADKDENLIRKFYFWQEGKRLARYEQRVAKDFAGHITCSDLDSDRLRELVPGVEPVSVPNGVDVQYFSALNLPKRQHSLVFVSTLTWYPNVDAVLFLLREIWPILKARLSDATLDIVGAGAPPAVIELAERLDGVKLHGFVPDIRPLVDTAAIFVCPIRDGGGTKLKVLDAFAMEKCVVAHPIACEGIEVKDGANVVMANTAADFVLQIVSLLEDDERRARIGRAARDLATSRYAFEDIGKHLEKIFREIANASVPAANVAEGLC